MNEELFQRLQALSERQLETIEKLSGGVQKLTDIVEQLQMRVTLLEGDAMGFQARFEALEKKL